jgi:DNA-directed RNA polymerase specialized sigma24 family protein
MRALGHYDYHSPLAPVISLDAAMSEPGKDGNPAGDIEAPFTPFEDALAVEEAAAAVRRFIHSLPKRQREMILRHFWHGESQAEIARAQGVTGAAISRSMAKILKRGRLPLSSYRSAYLLLQVA